MSELTKAELRVHLHNGKTLDGLFRFTNGDSCLIFKAGTFRPCDEIVYIPDIGLNGLPVDRPITGEDELDEVLSCCYTGNDFVQLCREAGVDEKYAERLFRLCDWQHPSSVLGEGWPEED